MYFKLVLLLLFILVQFVYQIFLRFIPIRFCEHKKSSKSFNRQQKENEKCFFLFIKFFFFGDSFGPYFLLYCVFDFSILICFFDKKEKMRKKIEEIFSLISVSLFYRFSFRIRSIREPFGVLLREEIRLANCHQVFCKALGCFFSLLTCPHERASTERRYIRMNCES